MNLEEAISLALAGKKVRHPNYLDGAALHLSQDKEGALLIGGVGYFYITAETPRDGWEKVSTKTAEFAMWILWDIKRCFCPDHLLTIDGRLLDGSKHPMWDQCKRRVIPGTSIIIPVEWE